MIFVKKLHHGSSRPKNHLGILFGNELNNSKISTDLEKKYHGGSTALHAVYTVDTVDMVYAVDTVYMDYTVHMVFTVDMVAAIPQEKVQNG